jgi:hypothetical protein
MARWVVAPAVLYAAAFFVLTYPWVRSFSTHFFCDAGDGLQNVWNLWWVRKAILELGQLPWHTSWLHAPHGTTLVAHTLNPINGFLAIPLGFFFPLVVAHNVIVTVAFVGAGLATFWLCYRDGRHFWASFAAGAFFTFSEYHLAHAEGHLQLVSLQFMPLFLLSWLRLLEAPGLGRAGASAVALVAVLLGDHYYFAYCVGAALILLAWDLRGEAHLRRARLIGAAAALSLAGAASAPLLVRVALLHSGEGLEGAHDPRLFSVDLSALLVPGPRWAFHRLTEPVWSRTGASNELAVQPALPLAVLAGIGAWRARARASARIPAWLAVAAVFFVFALGPALRVGGREWGLSLPYALAERLFPVLRVSGVPARAMAMVLLSLSIGAAKGIVELEGLAARRRRAAGIALVASTAALLWPAPLPLTAAQAPPWVEALRALPPGAVLCEDEPPYGRGLYYQTIYEKPRAGGFIARTPLTVARKTNIVMAELGARHFARLRRHYGFAYVVRRGPLDLPVLQPVFERDGVWIYRILLPGERKEVKREVPWYSPSKP